MAPPPEEVVAIARVVVGNGIIWPWEEITVVLGDEEDEMVWTVETLNIVMVVMTKGLAGSINMMEVDTFVTEEMGSGGMSGFEDTRRRNDCKSGPSETRVVAIANTVVVELVKTTALVFKPKLLVKIRNSR